MICVDTNYPRHGFPARLVRGRAYRGRTWRVAYYGGTLAGTGRPSGGETSVSWLSRHPGGAHFLFADGHLTFLAETIAQDTLNALTTRDGGETIDIQN